MSVVDRLAIVVGNSDGIGLALTRRLLADGWSVAGLSRSAGPVSDARYRHEIVDVTAPDYADRLRAMLTGRAPDVCVYAAGIGEILDPTDPAGFPRQTRTLDVNLMGAARTAEVVVPAMVGAGRGHFVGVSSLADVTVSAEAPAYAASKAGLTTYLLGLRLALRPHGVAVTSVRFGFVDTKLAQGPVKPMMISTERAVDVLLRAMRTRPAVVSHPRTMAIAARGLRAAMAIQLRR